MYNYGAEEKDIAKLCKVTRSFVDYTIRKFRHHGYDYFCKPNKSNKFRVFTDIHKKYLIDIDKFSSRHI